MLSQAEENGKAVAIGLPLAIVLYFVGTYEKRPKR